MDNVNILPSTVGSRDARYLEKVWGGYQEQTSQDTLVLQMLVKKLSSLERQLKGLATPLAYQEYQGPIQQASETEERKPRRIEPRMLRKIFD